MSNVIVPVSDFAALITRIEAIEAKVREQIADGVYAYGPCSRCGYGPWDSYRAHPPRCCPKCHSAYWDTPPRKSYARTPQDPPNPAWDVRKVARRKRKAGPDAVAPTTSTTTTVASPTSAAPTRAVVLPPELRPPGEQLIPPPPRIAPDLPDVTAMRTVDNPMNVRPVEVAPTEHVAVMPETIIERLLDGQPVTYEDIKAAKEGGDGDSDPRGPSDVGTDDKPVEAQGSGAPEVHTARSEKVEAFFADAIATGLVAPVVEGTPVDDKTPFLKGEDPPSLAPVKNDDPFWK